jgi:UDP-N-acetyl-D-mannosaminuronic acid transferase (WecB/TagA/CpsF family)
LFAFDEGAIIRNDMEHGNAYAALGILYARELLQQGMNDGCWRRSVVTSAWIHLDIIPHLSTIFDRAESIIVITGRAELQDETRARLGERLEAFITVPVQGFVPPSPEQSHLFSAFPDVQQRLSQDLRGKLVLVGAGLFGKVYCHVAKLHGAVAIDLGSAFDVLAGLKTRPIYKNYDIGAMRWI